MILQNLELEELSIKEKLNNQGGDWLADEFANLFCGCPQKRHTHGRTYPR
ncbi:hypothetical protein [Zobellia russellii]